MFNEVLNNSKIRPPYNKVFNWAEALPKNIILKKQIQAENLFKKIGVTFSVYNNYDVSERLIPLPFEKIKTVTVVSNTGSKDVSSSPFMDLYRRG